MASLLHVFLSCKIQVVNIKGGRGLCGSSGYANAVEVVCFSRTLKKHCEVGGQSRVCSVENIKSFIITYIIQVPFSKQMLLGSDQSHYFRG